MSADGNVASDDAFVGMVAYDNAGPTSPRPSTSSHPNSGHSQPPQTSYNFTASIAPKS